MENKNLILAIGLSFVIILIWSSLNKPNTIAPSAKITEQSPIAMPSPEQKQAQESLTKYSRQEIEIIFNQPNAAIKEVVFKNYQNHLFVLNQGLALKSEQAGFQLVKLTKDSAEFVYTDQTKTITKSFLFSNSSYNIDLRIEVLNTSSSPITQPLSVVLGKLDLSTSNPQSRYQDVFVSMPDKAKHFNVGKNQSFNSINFIGLRDRYFCEVIEPVNKNGSGQIQKQDSFSEISLISPDINLLPNQKIQINYRIYLGPQDLRLINPIKPEWSAIVSFGTFDVIGQILLQILEFLYKIVHNWGWAIVLLSLLVYIVLFPLSFKQMHSMHKMQALQPQIQELQKLYKNNQQRLQKELMELYRKNKVNPFSGCLPLILQIPIFFALYSVLSRTITLKGAEFLWIKDLAEPDRFVIGDFHVNILPILMALIMFVQQKISSTASGGGTFSQQQKMMTFIFPVMFGIFFYSVPSGLVLYWLVNSVLMLAYQFKMNMAK